MRDWRSGIASPNEVSLAYITASPVITGRRVLWVSYSDTNAADNANRDGTQREAPFKTMDYCVTNRLADDDIVIWLDGPTTPEPVAWTLASRVTIVGCQSDSSRPSIRYGGAGAGTTPMVIVSVGCVEFYGVIFRGYGTGGEATVYASCHVRVNDAANAPYFEYCQFVFESYFSIAMPANGVMLGHSAACPSYAEFYNCEWLNNCAVPEGTGASDIAPFTCIKVAIGSVTATGLRVRSCTFDGGSSGFDAGAISCAASVVFRDLLIRDNTFENGADVNISAGTWWGIFSNNTLDPSCNIEITPLGYNCEQGLVDATVDGGDAILSNPGLILSGQQYWVNPKHPLASDSNAGNRRDLPLRTWKQAATNCSDGSCDLIIGDFGFDKNGNPVACEFAWDSSDVIVISNNEVKMFGLGAGSTQPTITINNDTGASGTFYGISGGQGLVINGLRFLASTRDSAGDVTRINLANAGAVVENCYFECGAYDVKSIAIGTNALSHRIDGNTLVVTASGATDGIYIAAASATPKRSLVQNNAFDGGGIGWGTAAIEYSSSATHERTLLYGNNFLARSGGYVTSDTQRLVWAGNAGQGGRIKSL